MSKLNEIVFKPIVSKEYEFFGQKVVLKALTTKDNLELDLNSNLDNPNTKDLLEMALKILSKSIVKVNDVTPDNSQEIVEMLKNQEPEVVFSMLNKYQELSGVVTKEEIKN